MDLENRYIKLLGVTLVLTVSTCVKGEFRCMPVFDNEKQISFDQNPDLFSEEAVSFDELLLWFDQVLSQNEIVKKDDFSQKEVSSLMLPQVYSLKYIGTLFPVKKLLENSIKHSPQKYAQLLLGILCRELHSSISPDGIVKKCTSLFDGSCSISRAGPEFC